MKFTLSWLKEHLDTTATLEQIGKTLTMIGLEVESVTNRAATLQAFTVAKILHAEKHPEADKLRVCKVQSNIGELQIVCGASNARAGIFVALAKEGAHIPASGMVIKKTKIRGVESNGMLCSAEELALPGDSSGIIELPESPIGMPIAQVLGLDDPVIEIAITPNRADCLGVRGIARDLAAAGLGALKNAPDYVKGSDDFWASPAFGAFPSPVNAKVEVSGSECTAFDGYYIRNVKNECSPDWIKHRLEAIGQKTISALVDITNYLMLDLGRPMHAYDADKIVGNITVRNAFESEQFKALNGEEYILDPTMVVIADDRGVIGLAGIIGGESTACSTETKNIFLEVANFNPANIAQTARKLSILSDARYRFERGVDSHTHIKIGTVEQPIDRDVPSVAVYLMIKYCGGTSSHLVDALVQGGFKARTISFNPQRVGTLGGVSISTDECLRILGALGCTIHDPRSTIHEITPPSWRGDIEGEADLVEEVLRIHGYDNIPAAPLPKLPGISRPAITYPQKRAHIAKRTLAARGMMECCTWSFLPEAQAKSFGWNNPALTLLNPISADLDTMRPSLLPNLLEAAKKNGFRGFKDNALFEVGLQFHDITPGGQRLAAAGIRTGQHMQNTYKDTLYQHNERAQDAFDAKTDALAVLQALGVTKCDITTHTPSWYHPGRSGALTLGGKIILGYFGEVHPGLLPGFDLEGRVAAFEIFLDALPVPRAKGKAKTALKLSEFQAVERDFAFIVEDKITAADITKALAQADKNLVTGIEIFDVYAGKGVDDGKKSVAVKVTLQAMDRTLSDADITTVSNAIVAAAQKGFGGQLRQ